MVVIHKGVRYRDVDARQLGLADTEPTEAGDRVEGETTDPAPAGALVTSQTVKGRQSKTRSTKARSTSRNKAVTPGDADTKADQGSANDTPPANDAGDTSEGAADGDPDAGES